MNAPFPHPTPAKPADADQKPDWAMTRRDRRRLARAAAGHKPRRWPWLVLVLLLAAGGYLGYTRWQEQQAAAPVEVAAPADIVMQLNPREVVTVAPALLEETVKVTGTIAPGAQAELSSQVSGRIEAIDVRPGDSVARGDVVAQIDVENLRIQLNQQKSTAEATRAQLAQAESALERAQQLFEQKLTTNAALEQARTSVQALRANLGALEGQVAAAELALKNATITAPFSGIVAARPVEPGQLVSVGTPLMTIVDLSTVEFRAAAPVSAATQIARGQTVSVGVDGSAERFTGTVQRISPIAQEGTRTIPVYVSIDNKAGVLRGGMFATGLIVVDSVAEGIALVRTAIRSDADGDYVLKVDGDRLVRQPVERGRTWSGGRLVSIETGVAAGDVIVTAPLKELAPGTRIAVLEN
jgi:membrane fusion protein (multidrug efflux system)